MRVPIGDVDSDAVGEEMQGDANRCAGVEERVCHKLGCQQGGALETSAGQFSQVGRNPVSGDRGAFHDRIQV